MDWINSGEILYRTKFLNTYFPPDFILSVYLNNINTGDELTSFVDSCIPLKLPQNNTENRTSPVVILL